MIFSKSLVTNSVSHTMQSQWADVIGRRKAYRANEMQFAPVLHAANLSVNEGLIPQDVYQEFDKVAVERIRSDDGDIFLNDLLPQSRSINIGKLVHKFKRSSDAGASQTSMTGQTGVKMDQVEFSYDGSIIPVHDTGFSRNFREWNAQRSEGFDALIDDQRESVAELRRRLADNFLDGHRDVDGNYIVVDSISWKGMRVDDRVAQVDIGIDFTDVGLTYEELEAGFKAIRDVLWINNNCEKDATYYISREIASNFERHSSEFASSENKILQRLAGLMGVAAIKASSKLIGNEMMAFPLDGFSVRPLVGMGVNTVAMPRPVYNSNYEFVVWAAIGFEVRTDFDNRKCALFAQ